MWFVTLALCIVLLTLWMTWRKRKLSVFKNLNIPGPPPSLLFGNYWELYYKGQRECIDKWIKEYGRVFGFYYGLRPILIVADLELLRRIQMKDFQKFANRPSIFNSGSSSTRYNRYSLVEVQGKRWKELRSIITPTFTASKLKKMNPIINEAVNELVDVVERESANGRSFDIYHLYQNLTMDVIARTSLGFNTRAQADRDGPFVKLARLIFSLKMSFMAVLTFSFTEVMPLFSFMKTLSLSLKNKGKFPRGEMQDRTAEAIKARRENPEYRRPDVLQLMMDAKRTDEIVNDKNLAAGENEDTIPNGTTKEVPAKNAQGLTDDEILQNCVLFLLAGFETTSTALAFLTHCLIHHQDIQDKVREEINESIADNVELSYDAVNNLQYLDNVLNETLRMYPPLTYFVNREATEDTIIDKIRIPKGITIQVPIYYLHHDPTIWEEPENFNPDRFLPEEKSKRDPMAFQPFGAGPRNCIGMRFAQMEVKMAIAKLIKKYRLLPENGTKKEDFKISYTIASLRPEEGVHIRVEPL